MTYSQKVFALVFWVSMIVFGIFMTVTMKGQPPTNPALINLSSLQAPVSSLPQLVATAFPPGATKAEVIFLQLDPSLFSLTALPRTAAGYRRMLVKPVNMIRWDVPGIRQTDGSYIFTAPIPTVSVIVLAVFRNGVKQKPYLEPNGQPDYQLDPTNSLHMIPNVVGGQWGSDDVVTMLYEFRGQ